MLPIRGKLGHSRSGIEWLLDQGRANSI